MGKFKFLSRDDGTELEQSAGFLEAVNKNKPRGLVKYVREFEGQRCKSKVAKDNKIRPPGYGDRFTVVWVNEDSQIMTDQAVKLYMLEDVIMHEEFCKGPKSPWFGLVHPNSTYDKKVGFDENMFWSVGLLYKHLGTCGVASWDREIQELQCTYQ